MERLNKRLKNFGSLSASKYAAF